jgi:hypothetical protein
MVVSGELSSKQTASVQLFGSLAGGEPSTCAGLGVQATQSTRRLIVSIAALPVVGKRVRAMVP